MQLNRTEKWLLLLIILVTIKVFFFPPFELQLRSEEPRRALISMEMIFSGNYLEPHLNGWPYYNKPPLFNWLLVLFMQLFKSFDEWVVRLPGLLSHVLLSVAIYFFAKRYLTLRAAITAALFYLTAGEVLFYGSVIAGQIDLFYSLLVFLQLAFLFTGLNEAKRIPIYLSYLFLALGILTKGVPSIAFQILTILLWFLLQGGSVKQWLIVSHLIGTTIAVMLIGGYFYIYSRQGGDAMIYLINLFKEAAQKSALETSGATLIKNFLNFPGAFLKLLLPWIILMYLILHRSIRLSIWRNPFVRYSIAVILGNIFLYWFSEYVTTRYLFPFIPFLAIITAQVTLSAQEQKTERILTYFYWFIILLIILAPVGVLGYILSTERNLISYPWLKVTGSLILSFIIFLGMLRWKNHRLLLSVLFVLLLKWYSQWTYYPVRYTDEQINSLIAQIPVLFEHSGGNSIHLLGQPEQHEIDISLGHWSLISTTFSDPMPLSYQLPYYIERHQGSVMQFDTTPGTDRFYLVRKAEISQYIDLRETEVLYEFVDDWKRIPLALIKT